jgi:hypothetical protein
MDDCLEIHKGNCAGETDFRYPLSGTGQSFPRCDHHWDLRLVEQERIDSLYAPNSDSPPDGFDPLDAGERWDDEY